MIYSTCLVTGANGEIGQAMAKEFANNGYTVVATDLSFCPHPKHKNINEHILDVTDFSSIDNFYSDIEKKYSDVDVLINCAGILRSKPFEELRTEEWNQTLAVNLTGTFAMSQGAYRLMKKRRKGVIINIASDAGEIGSTMSSADYAASKAGVICLTKCIAREGAQYGIRANAIAPGFVHTKMLDKFIEYWGIDYFNQTINSIPLKRMGTAEEVAKLAYFLASQEASYITGATFDINGGSCMN